MNLFRPRPAGTRRIDELDGARGLAAIMVIVYHLAPIMFPPPHGLSGRIVMAVVGRLNIFIEAFFIISGIVVGGSLLDHRDAKNFAKVFFGRRAARLLPLYLVAIVSFYAISPFAPASPRVGVIFENPFPAWVYLSVSQNVFTALDGFGAYYLAPLWSVSLVVQFYMVAAAIRRMSGRRSMYAVIAASLVIAPVSRLVLLLWKPEAAVGTFVLLPCQIDSFFLGIAGGIILRDREKTTAVIRNSRLIGVCSGISILLLSGCLLLARAGNPIAIAVAGPSLAAAALFGLYLYLLSRSPSQWLKRLFRSQGLRSVGTIGYGLYVLHLPMAGVVAVAASRLGVDVGRHTPALLWAAVTLTLLTAIFSWNYFELPVYEAAKRRLTYSSGDPFVPSVEASEFVFPTPTTRASAWSPAPPNDSETNVDDATARAL